MSLSKKEIHRLVDSLPDCETQVVKRFIEFLLMQPQAEDLGERQPVTLDEAARTLQLGVRSLRQLIRDGVIPAHKVGGRWVIESTVIAAYRHPVSQAILRARTTRERLTRDDLLAIEEGRRDVLSGDTKSLDEIKRQYNVRQ